jgi:hypothetical protein
MPPLEWDYVDEEFDFDGTEPSEEPEEPGSDDEREPDPDPDSVHVSALSQTSRRLPRPFAPDHVRTCSFGGCEIAAGAKHFEHPASKKIICYDHHVQLRDIADQIAEARPEPPPTKKPVVIVPYWRQSEPQAEPREVVPFWRQAELGEEDK